MGNLKEGDQIIVTRVLCLNVDVTGKALINSVRKVVLVDISGDFSATRYPYKIKVEDSTFWVEGVPYSSLMMELV